MPDATDIYDMPRRAAVDMQLPTAIEAGRRPETGEVLVRVNDGMEWWTVRFTPATAKGLCDDIAAQVAALAP